MTIKELIEKLNQFDPDLPVLTLLPDGLYWVVDGVEPGYYTSAEQGDLCDIDAHTKKGWNRYQKRVGLGKEKKVYPGDNCVILD